MTDTNSPGERPCPVCGERMALAKRNAVEIDVCEQHGAWLDRGELNLIISRVRTEERPADRSALRSAKTSGKVSGMLFGPLSFLFD